MFEFPNVTSKINIKNLTAGQDLFVAFAEPRRAVDFVGTPNTYYSADISSLQLLEASTSIWINMQTFSTRRVFEFKHGSSGGASTRMQIHTSSELKFFVEGVAVSQGGGLPFSNNEWVHVAATIKSGESKLFVNGQTATPTNTETFSDILHTLNLGASTSNFDGIYDNASLFSRVLTESEIVELYNGGTFKDPKQTSVASEIVGLWDFEDNHYKQFYAVADTASLIKDRSASSNDLAIVGSASDATFVDGQLIENAFDRHKFTLSGVSEIDLGCKVKQVLIKADGALDLNVKASLTTIPTSRMYELSGTGIDE